MNPRLEPSHASPAPPAPRVPRAGLRRAAAAFWLNALFGAVRRLPGVVRAFRPVFVNGAWVCSPYLRRNTLANAARILGPASTGVERRRVARGVIGSFYDFVYDVGRCTRLSKEQIAGRIESVEGAEKYVAARAAGRGVVVVTAHMGSFEAGLVGLLERERKIHVVFRRDGSARFERIRSELRRRLGVIEAPIDDGWKIWIDLRNALLNDEAVVLQGDRVMPGQKGRAAPFCHGHVMFPTGPVKLARASGSPIVPVFAIRGPGGKIRIVIEDAIEVGEDLDEAMARVVGVIEAFVRRHPEQWLVLHKAWCEDNGGEEEIVHEGHEGARRQT